MLLYKILGVSEMGRKAKAYYYGKLSLKCSVVVLMCAFQGRKYIYFYTPIYSTPKNIVVCLWDTIGHCWNLEGKF